MKNFILILLLLVVLVLAFLYSRLFSRQASYYKMVQASDTQVVTLHNFDSARIKVIPTNTDMVIVDLKGAKEALSSLEISEEGLFTRFGLPTYWTGITGTIQVPRGTLIDVDLTNSHPLRINDARGDYKTRNTNSFLVDTQELSSLRLEDDGLLLKGEGQIIVWDDQRWDVLGDIEPVTQQAAEPYCGVGSRVIRNYCCVQKNAAITQPACDGQGHWIFSNDLQECSYYCGMTTTTPTSVEGASCTTGAQEQKNACCANKNAGIYQGCVGSWSLNADQQACQFTCTDISEVLDMESRTELVSQYCISIEKAEDKDQCCEDTLKNELFSGPRAGFPDCIGHWYYQGGAGCKFKCAEQAEMFQIIEQLKKKSQ